MSVNHELTAIFFSVSLLLLLFLGLPLWRWLGDWLRFGGRRQFQPERGATTNTTIRYTRSQWPSSLSSSSSSPLRFSVVVWQPSIILFIMWSLFSSRSGRATRLLGGERGVWMMATAEAFSMPLPIRRRRIHHHSRTCVPLWGRRRRRPGPVANFGTTTTSDAHNETTTTTTTTGLTWEQFEFGPAPKADGRFYETTNSTTSTTTSSSNPSTRSKQETLEELRAHERAVDAQAAQNHAAVGQAWKAVPSATLKQATALLRPYMSDARWTRMQTVFEQRTRHVHFVFENPSNPSNVWACLRTLDSFGIQHAHIIMDPDAYAEAGPATLKQKQGMRTAMGSAQWLTIHHYHASSQQALETIHQQFRLERHEQEHEQNELGAPESSLLSTTTTDATTTDGRPPRSCIVLASDLNPHAVDIRQVDWSQFGDTPLCIVMGNEERGISSTMREELADMTFTLPMCGFAESFNLSVATAITLAHLSAASSNNGGPLRPGDLSNRELQILQVKGALHSVAQKRMATTLLKQHGIVLPPLQSP